ncbi:kyphoscoliosis peptidase [Aplysia californica]|uniref:Kyphoscoliosis peptidase n=1 Tax=Aplysia californica TaxID=6500 RepID=A0ABM0JUP9_APLCA|nr:kyphoscoliosis peptidase [Aplysia californica]
MSERPTLLNGYLGSQLGFQELGLATKSHKEAEFETSENEFVIKLVASLPVKITTKVINEATGKESQERVFIQTRGQDISLLVSLDSPGYHKLQIYGLPASEQSKQLPGVFNYLINCTAMPRKSRLFPKQFAKWKEGCALLEPFSLAGDGLSGDVAFRVIVPEAHAVAVTIGESWTHLEPDDRGLWVGRVQGVEQYKGKGLSAVLNANFDEEDESKYFSLLQYSL